MLIFNTHSPGNSKKNELPKSQNSNCQQERQFGPNPIQYTKAAKNGKQTNSFFRNTSCYRICHIFCLLPIDCLVSEYWTDEPASQVSDYGDMPALQQLGGSATFGHGNASYSGGDSHRSGAESSRSVRFDPVRYSDGGGMSGMPGPPMSYPGDSRKDGGCRAGAPGGGSPKRFPL